MLLFRYKKSKNTDSNIFLNFFCLKKYFLYFCSPLRKTLTDGVTVALQFLELSVQVRILVGQRKMKPPDLFRGFFVWGI